MSEERAGTPVHLWIVGILSLLWGLMGAFDYTVTQLRVDSYMSQFTQEQLDYFYGFPSWVVAAWACAVWFGLAGSIGLLLRKRWAVWCFVISLVGLALSSVYNVLLTNGLEIMGTVATIFTVVIWVIAIFLVLYSRALAGKGVLT